MRAKQSAATRHVVIYSKAEMLHLAQGIKAIKTTKTTFGSDHSAYAEVFVGPEAPKHL